MPLFCRKVGILNQPDVTMRTRKVGDISEKNQQDLETGFGDCKAWSSEDGFQIHGQEEIVEHFSKDVDYRKNFLGDYS